MRKRIFLSALRDVVYVAGRPLTVKEFLARSPDSRALLKSLAD